MSKDTEPLSEQELIERARSAISDHALPDDVQRRLRLARARAAEQVTDDASVLSTLFGGYRWMIPAGAAATLVLAVTLTGSNPTEPVPLMDEQEFAAATDMELLDDMEFLAWMLEEDTAAGAPDDS